MTASWAVPLLRCLKIPTTLVLDDFPGTNFIRMSLTFSSIDDERAADKARLKELAAQASLSLLDTVTSYSTIAA